MTRAVERAVSRAEARKGDPKRHGEAAMYQVGQKGRQEKPSGIIQSQMVRS